MADKTLKYTQQSPKNVSRKSPLARDGKGNLEILKYLSS